MVDLEKYPTITQFMNRLLCTYVQDQQYIFDFFQATLDRVIAQAKKEGRYDNGIMDVVGQDKAVSTYSYIRNLVLIFLTSKLPLQKLLTTTKFKVRHATGFSHAIVSKFSITKGMTFEEACSLNENLQHKTEGFWLLKRKGWNYGRCAVLAISQPDAANYRHWKFLIYRPNTGKT